MNQSVTVPMEDICFFDTESCQFYGPTILIQYAWGGDAPVLHDVFDEPIHKTLELIERMMNSYIVGFNLAHDFYHLARTYNVLKEMPKGVPPNILDYHDLEDEDACHEVCLKPKGALDLLIHGRANEFQATMGQKDITMRKVPRVLASVLVEELKTRVDIPPLFFARSSKHAGAAEWQVLDLHKDTGKEITPEDQARINRGLSVPIDKDFVNLRLRFYPSTSLKSIVEHVLGHDVTHFDSFLKDLPKCKEYGWWPTKGDWLSVLPDHLWHWRNNTTMRKYAENDVVYTRELYHYFGRPHPNDSDSRLACFVGNSYWRGYALDLDIIRRKGKAHKIYLAAAEKQVNFKAPRQCLSYLHEVCDDFQKCYITDTKKETLEAIIKNETNSNGVGGSTELVRRAKLIYDARRVYREYDLYTKLFLAKRLYVTFKVTGTKSNRMSGGGFVKRGGSINPQGIKKEPELRSAFLLAWPDQILCGGDFSGFEVSIAEAVYGDAKLRSDLLSGKKIHALWGSALYNMTYDEVMATSEFNQDDPRGYYQRAKTSFFAKLYGAQGVKLANVTKLTEEEVNAAIKRFEEWYPGVAEAQRKLSRAFEAMYQPRGIGSAIEWREPTPYVESFLGFRRYFTMEFTVVKALYDLAQDPPDSFARIGKEIKLRRRERIQTGQGALQSAIYAAAFGIQSSVLRAAGNHEIQSPGGQICKELQEGIYDTFQPQGIGPFKVMPMNIHDEVEIPTAPELVGQLDQFVQDFVKRYKDSSVPLIGMDFKTHLKNWGEKG